MAAEAPARPRPSGRANYSRFVPLTTRWHDNDVYGHVNNVVYYAFFDTAVNQMLVEAGVLRPETSPVIGLVIETRCTYFDSIAFPDRIEVGVSVAHVGRTSVGYRLGVFKAGSATAAADGAFTHVYVDRATRRPAPLPDDLRQVVESWRSPA
jgi:acyl-CoA thioester hydrolase